jgi:hypothetical protein
LSATKRCSVLGHEKRILQRFGSGTSDQFDEGRTTMALRVPSVAIVLSFLSLTVAACAARPEPPAEGPPSPRLQAASTPEPRLALAALNPELADPAPEPAALALPPNAAPAAPASGAAACPSEMVLVEGEYCTDVKQICDDWMEAPRADGVGRCRHFAPSQCVGQRVHKRFCIDKDEYHEPGDPLPKVDVGWLTSQETCTKIGKRLCYESEWNFACEGEDMVPYATGQSRDANKCNYDQKQLLDHWGKPIDHRKTVAETEQCTSPFGIRNMNGNVDEWTYRDVTNGQWRSAMKGGWWMAARNRCRPATTAHDEHFHGFQSGFRCCSDAK